MKKPFKALNLTLTLLLVFLVFMSCDTEYSSIESNVLGEENFNFEAADTTYSVIAYNQKLSAQQINGLPSNLLGFYEDPIYGKTTASIVAQILPKVFEPTFGTGKKIESVKLTIPYFSTRTGITSDVPDYRIDSLYVKNNDTINNKPIKLSVYENRYFLSNLSLSDSDSRSYFSIADILDNGGNNSMRTETSTINFEEHLGYKFYDNNYTISNKALETTTGTGDDAETTYAKPAIELELAKTETEKAFWESLILDQEGNPSLSNANQFLNHFRGLHIKAEAIDDQGAMVLLDLLDTEANIVVNYSTDDEDNDGERESKTYEINFSGNILNTFINDYTIGLIPINPDTENGDEKLFLKGNEGALTVIELFNDDDDKKINCNCGKDSSGNDINVNVTELGCFKKTYRKTDDQGNELEPVNGIFELKQLLNEAHLVIYEDEDIKDASIVDSNMEDFHKYDRLYIYDIENNIPLLDYLSDPTANTGNPLTSHNFSLGTRQKTTDGKYNYKIKLTDHLNNILLREDSDNPKLGLIISNNVNVNQNTETLNAEIEGVPATAILSPRGTVLYGSNVEDSKKIKLKLFYTGIK